jgi:hypothetical protein
LRHALVRRYAGWDRARRPAAHCQSVSRSVTLRDPFGHQVGLSAVSPDTSSIGIPFIQGLLCGRPRRGCVAARLGRNESFRQLALDMILVRPVQREPLTGAPFQLL